MANKIRVRTCYSIAGSDYSAQEPRSLASFSNDKEMLKAYEEDKDLYAVIGQAIFNNNYEDNLEHNPLTGEINPEGKKRRSTAKMVNLAISYSMSAHSMSKKVDVSVERAEEIIKDFYKKFVGVKKFTEESEKMLLEKGYVTDLWGRRRHLPDAQLPDFFFFSIKEISQFNPLIGAIPHEDLTTQAKIKHYQDKLSKAKWKKDADLIIASAKKDGLKVRNNKAFKSKALRQCLNARIQGSAASMTKLALTKIHSDELLNELGTELICTVHDEILVRCPREYSEEVGNRISDLMIEAAKDKCICKFKCDPTIEARWNESSCVAEVHKDYNNLIKKGLTEEEAFKKVVDKYQMISQNYLEQMCKESYVVNTHDDI